MADSRIVLTDRFDETVEAFRNLWPDTLFFRVHADDFLVEHAKEAVERAVLTSDREKVVVLSANFFTPIAQNKLLKILEEPPPNTHFLLLTPSKSGLLPTIRSRLPVENRLEAQVEEESGVDLAHFDLAQLFKTLQENRRIDAKKAIRLVESLAKEAMRSGRFTMDEELLAAFEQSVRLLDMGSPPNFVLTRLGVKLLEKRR
ncbi:DNA polymerase III subunit delta' [Hydrogenimonas sp.]